MCNHRIIRIISICFHEQQLPFEEELRMVQETPEKLLAAFCFHLPLVCRHGSGSPRQTLAPLCEDSSCWSLAPETRPPPPPGPWDKVTAEVSIQIPVNVSTNICQQHPQSTLINTLYLVCSRI